MLARVNAHVKQHAARQFSHVAAARTLPTIKSLKAYVPDAVHTGEQGGQGSDCHDVPIDHWINGVTPMPIANPMSAYPKYAGARTSWGINALGSCVVEVETEDGTTGVGVTTGGEPACYIVENHLSRFVEGEDPRNVEKMFDQMWRATTNYGRKGLPLQAISAVDLALWDLLGKLRNEPVYALLGGKTKDRLPVYCTSAKPEVAQAMGFAGAKVPCPYGPAEGEAGLKANVAYFAECRAKVGPDFPLMLDCYMSLSAPYAIRLAKALEPYGCKWIEEFLPPDDYEGYVEVKKALSDCAVMTTTGEHEYTRYGFRRLIADRAVDILQPDVTWMGGITEARRVVAMAAAYDVPIIPHGSSVYSYHLQYAFANCPLAEFINLHPTSDELAPYFGGLFADEPLPRGGFIDLPDRPGFGVTLVRDNLHRPYARSDAESAHNAAATREPEAASAPRVPF